MLTANSINAQGGGFVTPPPAMCSAKPWWPDGAPADARSRGSAYVGTPCFLCSGSGSVVHHKAGEDCPREWKRTPRGEG